MTPRPFPVPDDGGDPERRRQIEAELDEIFLGGPRVTYPIEEVLEEIEREFRERWPDEPDPTDES